MGVLSAIQERSNNYSENSVKAHNVRCKNYESNRFVSKLLINESDGKLMKIIKIFSFCIAACLLPVCGHGKTLYTKAVSYFRKPALSDSSPDSESSKTKGPFGDQE
jgi:hypothetical protein